MSKEVATVRKQLKEMARKDQEVRQGHILDWKRVDSIDEANTSTLKGIVNKYGWITFSKFGKRSSKDAWLLLQHASHDIDFQEYCLQLMTDLAQGEIDKSDLAYLTDVIMTAKTGKQKYGTRMVDKEIYSYLVPVVDPEGLDRRRKEMGLPPIAEYLTWFDEAPAYLTEEEALKHTKAA